MFTGIDRRGWPASQGVKGGHGDLRLRIDTGSRCRSTACRGESIAVNGCCLTVVEFDARNSQPMPPTRRWR
jgi:riboflavin synthase